jgi:DNA-binding NtrC family response regulator
MANRANGIQKYVMIVEADVNIATMRADWLAPHGYQAVLVRSVEGVVEKLTYLRPQLVCVGRDHSKPSAQIKISQIVQLIRTVCPGVPMITIEDRGHQDETAASRAADVVVATLISGQKTD